jgi:hypothetical protein
MLEKRLFYVVLYSDYSNSYVLTNQEQWFFFATETFLMKL